jgi:hypothetical protein
VESAAGHDPDLGLVSCAGCHREADEFEVIAERWGSWSDGLGELLPFCPTCGEQEFGHVLPATKGRRQGLH